MKKINILILLILSFVMTIEAQDNRQYSMYGYGLLSDRATSMQRQMGSIGYAMRSGRQINVMNPASYAAIDSLTFLFDMGADFTMSWQKQDDQKERSYGGGLDYITMQFPLSKHIGASIGLIPYSYVGYAFGTEIQHGAMTNQGEGGINQAYVGLSGIVAGFSLGANVAYSFGNIINDVFSSPVISGQTLFEHVMQIRDWDIVIGAQYSAQLTMNDKLNFGVTYSPKKSIHGQTWATLQETTKDSKADTVAYMNMKGKYFTPTSIGAGIGFTHERLGKWMVEFDFTFQQWSKAEYSPLYSIKDPENMVFQGMNFRDRTKFALGGEYIPRVRGGNYAQRMSYRAGAYFNNDYLNIQGNRLREYGVTAGVGLNTPEGKTMVNIGFEWKHRQGVPNALITENFFNITLGLNFNELWFWKRKIR